MSEIISHMSSIPEDRWEKAFGKKEEITIIDMGEYGTLELKHDPNFPKDYMEMQADTNEC